MLATTPHTTRMIRQALCALMAIATLGATLTTAAPEAAAQQRSGDYTASFRELSMSHHRGQWSIDYKLGKRSWRALKDAGINPQLAIYAPAGNRYEFLYAADLTAREGRLVLPPRMGLRDARTVEIRVVGYKGFSRVSATAFGRESGRRVRIALGGGHGHHGHHGHHNPGPGPDVVPGPGPGHTTTTVVVTEPAPPRNWAAEVINACKRHTKFSSDFNRCQSLGMKQPPYIAPAVVDACGTNGRGDGGRLTTCLELASGLKVDRVETARACAARAKFSSEVRECMSAAASHHYMPSEAVKACGKYSKFSSEFKACMDNSASLGRGKLGIIEACGQNSKFSSEMTRCLQNASR